ncbi:MAG TPA: peptide ABC transporter substrate-binding protein [Candidatus Saccharimonadia bacterium]
MFSYLQFRYRRSWRRLRRDTRLIARWGQNYINRHIWGKWHQVRLVRRFLLVWWLLIAVSAVGLLQQLGGLQRVASRVVAASGGTYIEAAVGDVQGINPILPDSAASTDISRLIFSGLTRYNSLRQIVPDLATWDVSNDGKTYTFHLRHGVKWHDGVPFSSADVAFTLTAIQNPDSRSPLASSWQGVNFETQGDDTIVIKLPQPLNSFLDSTTVGILPRHLLESVDPTTLREAEFNQNPVGTGPFKMKTFAPAAKTIELEANPDYYLGRPRLAEFDFKLYDTSTDALNAFAQHQVTSPGRLMPEDLGQDVAGDAHLTNYPMTLPEEKVLFFNAENKLLSDKTLRQILSRSLNRDEIVSRASGGQAIALTQPLLPGQLGYTNKYALPSLDQATAKSALENAGWALPHGATARVKDGAKLQFTLVTLEGGELSAAANEVKRQWAPLGIELTVKTVPRDQLQQTYMRPRNFQMLLYGVNLGSDPDVYSFWHSSQAKDPGVNLSQYNSADADRALETARIKSDASVRQGKYDAFLKAWNTDAPAAVLYQQGYVYATRDTATGIKAHRLVSPADRFYDIQRWTVLQRFTR